jgi:hypothetical protein
MGLQIGKDVLGVAKQTALGTIAVNPAYAHGMSSDKSAVAPSDAPDPLTSAYLAAQGAYRDKIDTTIDIETRMWQKSVGLYLLAALGADSVSGTGTFTHIFTLASSLPYLSFFGKKGDGSIIGMRDSKIDGINIKWTGNGAIAFSVKAICGTFSFPATFAPTATDESDTTAYYTPVGGTFKYDLTTGTPVLASIIDAEVDIQRNSASVMYSGAIEAGDVQEGGCDITVSLTVLPADLTLWRKIVTGSTTGTSLLTTPQYGSAELNFNASPDSLKLQFPRVEFLSDMPNADPKGGAAQSQLVGTAYRSGATSPITATLVNTVATY